jgi:hypothetical protein
MSRNRVGELLSRHVARSDFPAVASCGTRWRDSCEEIASVAEPELEPHLRLLEVNAKDTLALLAPHGICLVLVMQMFASGKVLTRICRAAELARHHYLHRLILGE